jgi:hypothetical protein
VGVFVQTEDAVGERIAVVMVVEEPTVEFGVTQRGLDFVEIHDAGDPSPPREFTRNLVFVFLHLANAYAAKYS